MKVDVQQAARRLEVSPRRVRQLIADGALRAERFGGAWILDEDSVAGRLRLGAQPGRPLAKGNAWRLARIADEAEREQALRSAGSSVQRWRAAKSLERIASLNADELAMKLRSRYDKLLYRFVHPSVLEDLAGDDHVIVSGPRAAAAWGSDLVSSDRLQAYVRAADVPALEQRYGMQPIDAGQENVLLRVVSGAIDAEDSRVAPRLFVAVDLAESDDARARRAAEEILRFR